MPLYCRGAYMENVDRVHPEEQDNVDSVRQTISGICDTSNSAILLPSTFTTNP